MTSKLSDTNLKLAEFTKQYSAYESESQHYPNEDEAPNSLGPHYEVPNLTSMLYDFTNKEKDRIEQGFRIGNFVSLRDLPRTMMAGAVL